MLINKIKWLIRFAMFFVLIVIIAVISMPYIVSHYAQKVPALISDVGLQIDSLEFTQTLTGNQMTFGPQQFTIEMGTNTLLLDVNSVAVKVDWLDSIINFKPTLSSVEADISNIRFTFVASDPDLQITLDDVVQALRLSDYLVLANCEIKLETFIFDFVNQANLVEVTDINLQWNADRKAKLTKLTATILDESLAVNLFQLDDELTINTKLDSINLNRLISRLLNFDSSLELSVGWDVAINLKDYIIQTGQGKLNLPWLVFGNNDNSKFDIKFDNNSGKLAFELSEAADGLAHDERAVIQGHSDFANERLVIELHNVEVGAPYLLALEEAPLAPTLRDQLREFAIQGKLEYGIIRVPFDDLLSASAVAQVSKVSMQSVYQKFPGFNDVDVLVQYVNSSLFVDIDQDDMQFYFAGFFDEIIYLKEVNGVVKISFQPDGVYIDARSLIFNTDFVQNPQLSLSVRLVPEIDITLTNFPSIDLTVKAEQIDANKIWSVLPRLNVLNATVDYIKDAIISGSGQNLALVLSTGLGGETPFYIDGQAQVNDVTLEIDPEWAVIQNANASIIMHGEEVSIIEVSALTTDLRVENGTVLIARDQHLSENFPGYTPIWVEGDISGKLADGIRFLQQSPIWVDIEDALEDTIPTGNINGTLADLIIYIPDDEREVEIAGDVNINFLSAGLEWPEMYIPITNITGTLVYSGDKAMSSENLAGNFYGNEMTIDLHGDRPIAEDFAHHIVSAQSIIKAETLSYWMDDWNKFMSGATEFTMNFDIISHHSWEPIIDIKTDFAGMHFYLPIPFGKTTEQLRPTTFKLLVEQSNEEKVRFWFQSQELCGDVWAGDLGVTGDILIDSPVLCDEAKTTIPSSKVAAVRGSLPFADASSWMDFIRETPVDAEPIPIADIIDFDIDIDIAQIGITSMIIEQNNIKVTSDNVAIYVQGEGNHFKGTATIPSDKKQRATGDVSLTLTNLPATPEQWSWVLDPLVPKWTAFDPDNLQPFDITISDLGSNNTRLGDGRLYTVHRPQEVDVFFELNSPDLTLVHSEGKGAKLAWKLYDKLSTGIDVSIGLNGNSFNELLKDVGLEQYVSFEQLDYESNLTWYGDVTDINLDSLQGHLNFNAQDLFLGKTITKEVNLPSVIALQVTRFLDVFSLLGSLLTLNFKDLQWQNISQSLFQFQFEPRKIEVKNVIIETSHIVSARGVIDEIDTENFDNTDIDLSVFIRPNVSASLPLLWASACGAPCFLAVLLVDQFISINDESTIGMKVFGKAGDTKVVELANRIDSGKDWLDNTSREVFILQPPLLPQQPPPTSSTP